MDINWEELDSKIDNTAIAEAVKDSGKNKKHEDVPSGQYEVKITKLEQTRAKSSGNPMVTIWFKILAGTHKNATIFANFVIVDMAGKKDLNFNISNVNKILRKLVSEIKTAPSIEYINLKQYNQLILDVAELIDGKFEYAMKYGETNKGFKTYEIVEVYPLD